MGWCLMCAAGVEGRLPRVLMVARAHSVSPTLIIQRIIQRRCHVQFPIPPTLIKTNLHRFAGQMSRNSAGVRPHASLGPASFGATDSPGHNAVPQISQPDAASKDAS
eukprot:7387018-Prymnesium_polylepis.3